MQSTVSINIIAWKWGHCLEILHWMILVCTLHRRKWNDRGRCYGNIQLDCLRRMFTLWKCATYFLKRFVKTNVFSHHIQFKYRLSNVKNIRLKTNMLRWRNSPNEHDRELNFCLHSKCHCNCGWWRPSIRINSKQKDWWDTNNTIELDIANGI